MVWCWLVVVVVLVCWCVWSWSLLVCWCVCWLVVVLRVLCVASKLVLVTIKSWQPLPDPPAAVADPFEGLPGDCIEFVTGGALE